MLHKKAADLVHESDPGTLTSKAPAVTYSEAAQIADWGAALAALDTLDVAIHQISASYGRGAPLRATLYF